MTFCFAMTGSANISKITKQFLATPVVQNNIENQFSLCVIRS